MPRYKSPFSVDHRSAVEINSDDPRAHSTELEQYRSRLGRDLQVIKSKKTYAQLEKSKTVEQNDVNFIYTETYPNGTALIAYGSSLNNWKQMRGIQGNEPGSITGNLYGKEILVYNKGMWVGTSPDYTQSTINIVYSYDGKTWQRSPTLCPPGFFAFQDVLYGNERFVAMERYGTTRRTATSFNGIDWTFGTLPVPESPPSETYWTTIAYGNERFVVVDYNLNYSAVSTDGLSWDLYNIPGVPNSGHYISSLTFGYYSYIDENDIFITKPRFLLTTDSGAYRLTSENGISWTSETANYPPVNRTYYGKDTWFANFIAQINLDDFGFYSSNGVDWNPEQFTYGARVIGPIVYKNNLYAAPYGDTGFGLNCIIYSDDGLNWQKGNLLSLGTFPVSIRRVAIK